MVDVQIFLDQNYPSATDRLNIKELDISNRYLEGSLDFSKNLFPNLQKFNASYNKLTNLIWPWDVTTQKVIQNYLEEIDLSSNGLTGGYWFIGFPQFKKLNVSYNKYTKLNISNAQLIDLDCSNNLIDTLGIARKQ